MRERLVGLTTLADLGETREATRVLAERDKVLAGKYATIDARFRANARGKRLGELHEASGDSKRAIKRYGDFVELWKNADASLQPQVAEVRERIKGWCGRRGDRDRSRGRRVGRLTLHRRSVTCVLSG